MPAFRVILDRCSNVSRIHSSISSPQIYARGLRPLIAATSSTLMSSGANSDSISHHQPRTRLATLRFTAPAREDLRALYAFIAADGPDRARTFVEKIYARCMLLTTHPLAGRARPEFSFVDQGLRSLPVRPIIVFYRYDELLDVVDIVRVVDGRRDLHTLFAD